MGNGPPRWTPGDHDPPGAASVIFFPRGSRGESKTSLHHEREMRLVDAHCTDAIIGSETSFFFMMILRGNYGKL